MLVVVDLGNTRLKLGAFMGAELTAVEAVEGGRRIAEGAIPFPQLFSADEVVIGSSSPEQLDVLVKAIRRPVRVLGHDVLAAVATTYDDPRELGLDRLAAAWGARHICGAGPVVVVDVGTAITVDALDGEGRFVGVAIAPGVLAATDGLRRAAPHLPLPPRPGPLGAPAKGSAHSLRNGQILGACGAIERLVAEATSAVGGGATVVLTGGGAARLSAHLRCAHRVHADCVLHGLRTLHEAVPA